MRVCLLLLLFSLISCRDKKLPSGVLPPAKMKAVFYDYISADVYVNEFAGADRTLDPQKESVKLQKRIFEKHKISREQFYESYDYYVDHPGQMRDLIDSMIKSNDVKTLRTKKNLQLDKEYE